MEMTSTLASTFIVAAKTYDSGDDELLQKHYKRFFSLLRKLDFFFFTSGYRSVKEKPKY